jgi:cytochrome c2
MPATEQTWYSQKLLHVIFGFTSVLLLISTVWMFAADEKREWKGYQRQFRDVEQRLTKWRIAEIESASFEQQLDELHDQLKNARSQAPDTSLFQAFKSEVESNAGSRKVAPHNFDKLDAIYDKLEALSQQIATARQTLEATEAEQAAAATSVFESKAALAALSNPDKTTRKAAQTAVAAAEDQAKDAAQAVEKARQELESLADNMVAIRSSKFIGPLNKILKSAKDREIELSRQRKFKSADSDAAKAELSLAVRDGKSEAELAVIQEKIDWINDGDEITKGLQALTLERQAATAHRERLQNILGLIKVDEEQLLAQLDELTESKVRLETSYVERDVKYFTSRPPFLGKKWLELPILNAFNSPLKIDNLWTEGLTLANGSFGRVRRFDRCTTCHKGIDKAAPGTASDPAYLAGQTVKLSLQTPAAQPSADADGIPPTLQDVYGIGVAGYGLIDNNDASVNLVIPQSPAANAIVLEAEHGDLGAGLLVGDVIEYIGDDKVLSPADVEQFLFEGVDWGEEVELTIRRGLPNPYRSHPRLDLYVGSLSPHSVANFACTSCHEGQGSATSFAFASHTPNDPKQAEAWADEHGWFNNHHWIYPMYPQRFAESACLKCHHEVTELGPSARFAEAPAPKIIEGHELVKMYGCYACHEINGYDGPDKRVGPDLRLEPNYFAAAAAVKADASFTQLDSFTQSLADVVVHSPEDSSTRRELRDFLLADANSESPKLTAYSHKMADVLADAETPGQYRKAGPSLRFVGKKLDPTFMYDWIREPKNFRPSTKMPQFFGLWDHLRGAEIETAKRMERVEIVSMVFYLLNQSKLQPFDYLTPATDCEPGSAERGKVTFEVRGCLACHQHDDFPYADNTQGPNLSGLADKFATAPAAKQWLYSWVKQPTHYHARTKMPDLYLDPEETPDGKLVDPVADIVEYLLADTKGWSPAPESIDGLTVEPTDLDELALEYMTAAFPQRQAEKYLKQGIPAELAPSLKGAEVALVGGATQEQKLMYIGNKTISRYGCHACHDIPGFEDAKSIGTALADWGRKDSSKLAFEHIAEYLHGGHGHGSRSDAPGSEHAVQAADLDGHSAVEHDEEFDDSFHMEQLAHGDRSGFIWQKLTEPRSYDYHKVANKKYTDRLRMPLFPLGPESRESVVTFVLGLVADPPAEQFVYHGDPWRNAISEGMAVIQKYNCNGCHMLEPEQWNLEFPPDELDGQPTVDDFHYVLAKSSPEELATSAQPDPKRGVLKAQIHGMPSVDKDAVQVILDEEGDPIEEDEEYDPQSLIYSFDLWQPATIAGSTYQVGVKPMELPAKVIHKKHDTQGGDLAKWLVKRVVDLEKQVNPAADGTTAWGWVPPPLMGEGRKVQPEWLHGFLLEPYPIRPAVFLRMPKFNMSPDEATKLVNYFAAKDGAEFPFEYSPRTRPTHLAASQAEFGQKTGGQNRLDEAMNIVTSTQYCVQCHLIGDYKPEGSPRALAPDLGLVQYRLRPEYLRDWIANPKRILPYTSMPVNVVYDPNSETLGGVEQNLFVGTSVEQVDALVDLLMNYGDYSIQKNSVAGKVKQAKPAEQPQDDDKQKAAATTTRQPQRSARAERPQN